MNPSHLITRIQAFVYALRLGQMEKVLVLLLSASPVQARVRTKMQPSQPSVTNAAFRKDVTPTLLLPQSLRAFPGPKKFAKVHADFEGKAAQIKGRAARIADFYAPKLTSIYRDLGVKSVLARQTVAAGGGGSLEHVLALGLTGSALGH